MKFMLALALLFLLVACNGDQVYLMGTEDLAIELCAPNGGVKRIKITSGVQDAMTLDYTSYVKIECKDNSIEGSLQLDGLASEVVKKAPAQHQPASDSATQ